MIVKITFENGSSYLFGTKPFLFGWYETFIQFMKTYEMSKPVSVSVSGANWLKGDEVRYCVEEEFQELLDKEGEGRKAEHISFNLKLETVEDKVKKAYASGRLYR